MIYLEPNLYVRVVELQNGPLPLPSRSGFSADTAYRVLGIYTASESAECFFVLCNDRKETWFVSNRHFRIVGILPDAQGALHMPLASLDAPRPRPTAMPLGQLNAPHERGRLPVNAE